MSTTAITWSQLVLLPHSSVDVHVRVIISVVPQPLTELSIELMLNAVNINLVANARHLENLVGQAFVVFVIAVAAAEAAVGLGILLAFFRNKETVNIDEMNVMRW